tara:strand:+ start:770 stop:2065 length:1296 start_codon:yes stop_codon:yes gene_type:complete
MVSKFFRLQQHGVSVRSELFAGLSTFLTMAFIIAVNPSILSDSGIDFGAAFVATIFATMLGTLIMGLYAKWPVAVAPGMGLNAYFAYVVILGYGLSWQQALAAVFVSSVAFFIFSLSRARAWMILSIPAALQIAITAGIGLFLAMIGLTGAGIIVDNPDTLVGLGPLNTPETGLAVLGLIIMAGLAHRGFKSGILLTILGLSMIGWVTGLAEFGGVVSAPPLNSAAFQLDFSALATPAFLSVVFVMFFVDFFDTTGTLTAIAEPAGLRKKDGTIQNLDRAVLADTSASVFGSLLGTSNLTTYLESAAGIRSGGRTGLVAVTVAGLFGICLFFEPLFASIPAFATAPALIFVASGFLGGLARIDWTDMSVALPVMLTIILMPLTFSIAAGISIGFLTYVGIRFVNGRKDEINAGSLMIAAFGLIWLGLQYYG